MATPTSCDADHTAPRAGEWPEGCSCPAFGNIDGWLYSERDLFAVATTADGNIELSRWDRATGALDPVAQFEGGDAPLGIYPMETTPDGTGVWLGSSRGSDRLRLARLDLATGEEHEVDSHPQYDLDTRARVFPVLPSYLTLPVGIRPSRLPLVLFVHGGPWTRDSWGYHPAVQLFANRGCAVLQVNFRGSTGYGKAFTRAGIGEFAGKMHDDPIDGVRWAVDQGYADPDRVAIMGGSYGGYASLVGVTFTPDVFAAAVDVVGVANLAHFPRNQPDFIKPMLAYNWFTYVGDPADPEQEADMLARSPISRIDHIRTPLMVVHGANDARVVRAESDQLVEALRARDIPVAHTVMEDEGHAIENPENVIALYTAAEHFLAEHLGFGTCTA